MHTGLEKVDFHCLAESREFAEFSELFRNFTGISSAIYDKATGQTFVEHVQRRRVEEAKALLSRMPKSVTEICFQCGFTNLTHFNRVFRRWTDMSPRQYRKSRSER